jgi:CubicO group peptidase (beta-lactamase class C family)
MKRFRPSLPCILILCMAARAAGQTATAGPGADVLEVFDTFTAEQMRAWQVPGVALAVVREGKIVLSKGYGVRDREKNLPVTPRTLFAIGSITKSFTVATLGALVTRGKLDWDKPVREFLPESLGSAWFQPTV